MSVSISYPTVFNAIENFKGDMEALWLEATRNENLSPSTKFAVFSNDNEQAGRFATATALVAEALKIINSPVALTKPGLNQTERKG